MSRRRRSYCPDYRRPVALGLTELFLKEQLIKYMTSLLALFRSAETLLAMIGKDIRVKGKSVEGGILD